MDFRENLKLHLSFSDMRVKDLSELSGVKKSTIDSYLNNRVRMPSAEAAIRLARAFGVPVEHLFGSFEENAGLGHPAKQIQTRGLRHYQDERLTGEAKDLSKRLRDFANKLDGALNT